MIEALGKPGASKFLRQAGTTERRGQSERRVFARQAGTSPTRRGPPAKMFSVSSETSRPDAQVTALPGADPQHESVQETIIISTRRMRRAERNTLEAESYLPKVPRSLFGRVLCAHPEIATAIAAALLALTFLLPRDALTALVAIFALLGAWGWGQLIHAPAPRRTAVVIALTALGTVIMTRVFGDFSVVTEVTGLGMVAAFVMEMTRNPRPRLLDSVASTVAGILTFSAVGAWVVLGREQLWHFLVIPAAIILVGGCLGMGVAANWSPLQRATSATVGAMLFGLGAGAGIMFLQVPNPTQALIFTSGHLPTLWATLLSGAFLGLILGLFQGGTTLLFREDVAPATIPSALSLAMVPLILSAVPVYALARLVGGNIPV